VPNGPVREKIGGLLALPIRGCRRRRRPSTSATPSWQSHTAPDASASSAHTQILLGWTPSHATLLEDLEHGDYINGTTQSNE